METAGEGKPMTAVRGLDLERYMGRWYEIACFPSAFQPRDGRGTRATYALRPDGTVRVLNETWTAGGSRRASIEGTAFRADPADEKAGLKVRFYLPPFLPVFPVVGDYWVLFVDENYQHAVVGQPSRKLLWILSRQIHMEEDVYNQLVDEAKEQGYDVKKLQKTQQIDPPPLGEEGLNDTKGFWWIKSLLGK